MPLCSTPQVGACSDCLLLYHSVMATVLQCFAQQGMHEHYVNEMAHPPTFVPLPFSICP